MYIFILTNIINQFRLNMYFIKVIINNLRLHYRLEAIHCCASTSQCYMFEFIIRVYIIFKLINM